MKQWHRDANQLARELWAEGLKFEAYQLMRAVIRDATREDEIK